MKLFPTFVKFIRFLFYSSLLVVACTTIALTLLIFICAKDLPKLPQPLSRIIETPRTEIFAASGQKLISLGVRESVPLNRVSKNFINAILAVEDHKFYEHHGINKLRTLKALYITLFKPGKIQGASTITQQLSKNLFFSFEQSYLRKFKELLVSLQIETTSTKDEILHAYINQIHFGAGTQGIEKASRVFFGKSASDLSLSEAALLAGLPKSPTEYNPYKNYEKAIKRRNIVLKRMEDIGFISELQKMAVIETKPELSREHADSRTGSYYLDALIKELIQKYGAEVVYHGGIKVTATINTELQNAAEKSVKNGLERLDDLMGLDKDQIERPQAALVAVDTNSGAIKAMVGGRNYYTSEYNRAINGHRQVGSGFKPFLYYTAFEKLNMHPGTVVADMPVSIPVKGAPDWEPKNFSKSNRGDLILKKALTKSVNTIAARLVEQTGSEPVIETAKICGVKSRLHNVYSVALGTSPVTPLEMASAFATLAKGGVRHEPFMIWRVEDPFGRVIHEHIVQEKQVLDPVTTYQIIDMMKSVIDRGSGSSIRKLGFTRPAAGKTGTSDGFNDAWFIGFTPGLSTSVWTGFDKEKKLINKNGGGIPGGRSAAPIWTEFMKDALKNSHKKDFPIPKDIRFVAVDTVTGRAPVLQDSDNNTEAEIYTIALKKNQELNPPLKNLPGSVSAELDTPDNSLNNTLNLPPESTLDNVPDIKPSDTPPGAILEEDLDTGEDN
ncbi:MAG: PBP1A family penicillin-binding protein [Desulfobacteraceae bacterium]|nr:PBP1A family penicillin-binding protein [Desulfobacteraceae bacterium]